MIFQRSLATLPVAAHVGLSWGVTQTTKMAERIVLLADGRIDTEASDTRRAETADPSKTRKPPEPKLKPAPEAAVAAAGELPGEQGRADGRRRHNQSAGENRQRGAEGAG